MGDYDGQMIFGDIGALKLPDICLTSEEKPRKNLPQETCPDRGSNPGPLRDRCACYRVTHSGGHDTFVKNESWITVVTNFRHEIGAISEDKLWRVAGHVFSRCAACQIAQGHHFEQEL